ncbi:MAG: hypothetical protein EAZ97_13965 [Bacteroidetes bacterium]|nr:MAG: hypothetical protein EAZ97_13965 [Bacteroidota bacterium]
MNKLFLIFALFILSFPTFSQDENHDHNGGLTSKIKNQQNRANDLYDLYSYKAALELYIDIFQKDTSKHYAALRAAECYRKLNDPINCELWFSKIIHHKHVIKDQHLLHYAEALTSNQKYEEAKIWYKKYQKAKGKDSRSKSRIDKLDSLKMMLTDSNMYKIKIFPVNSPEADFSPAFVEKGIVFASSRQRSGGKKSIFEWNQSNFLDLYYSEIEKDSIPKEPKFFFDEELNSEYHEGPLCVFDSGTKMVFTRNTFYENKVKKSSDKVQKLSLYYAEKVKGKWTNIVPLPFNSPEYSVGHPTISKDEKTLYFSSDMPHEKAQGGTDIYKCHVENGKFTNLKNIGKPVNTEGNEMFPFLSHKHSLLFASNGHGGLGGLDMFIATYSKSKKWHHKVKNLGYPLNTNSDDFGLIISADKRYGYFSSNRKGGVGDDDIYQVRFLPAHPVKLRANIKLLKKYPEHTIVSNINEADLDLWHVEDSTLQTHALSDTAGNHIFNVISGEEYRVVGLKTPYGTDTVSIDIPLSAKGELVVELFLEIEAPRCVEYEGLVVDKETKEPIQNATVFIFNKKTQQLDERVTDAQGKYRICLDSISEYVVKGVKRGYLPDCNQIISGKIIAGIVSPETPLELEKIKINTKFAIENLYFDFDKYNIRPDAAKVLDELVVFLKQHTYIKVELGSHTDSRGSFKYNETLSSNRAISSVKYIIDNGIDPKRITAKGYGEYQLTNKCADNVFCSEPDHQLNRRTEVKVIDFLIPIDSVISDDASQHGQPFDKLGNYSNCDQVKLIEIKIQ